MKNRISSEYVPRMKVLTFADLMYYHIVIVENTQAQCFDVSFLNNDNTVMHKLCQFLATCSKPILVFVKTTKQRNKKRQVTDVNEPFLQNL